jgi:phosphohistidine swiveling domain-containing protein
MSFVHESAEPPKIAEVFHTETNAGNGKGVNMSQEMGDPLSNQYFSYLDQACIYFHDTTANLENAFVGGKATNMKKLGQIQSLSIPPWFVISSSVFQQFLVENDLIRTICELDLLCQNPQENSADIQRLAHKIRMLIQEKPLSQELYVKIKEAYEKLSLSSLSRHPSFAVRSSGIMEDSAASSCAGLYDTQLNEREIDPIIAAMKSVWASSFNPRVIQERIRLQLKQTQCQMGVIIQEQIDARSSGVISTLVLSNNYPGIQISGNYGVGESVVSGEVSVDGWVLHPTKGYILEEIKGSKESCHLLSSHEGVEMSNVPEEKRAAFVLDHIELSSLFSQVQNIKDHYDCDVDIEYALDQNGSVFILQARPLVNVQANEIRVVDVENINELNIIGRGHFSVAGVATGRLVFVESLEALEKEEIILQPQDIVLAYVTTNVWSQYLGHVRGLVTREGSPASHPILLCREKQVPCVIGITNDFERLIAHSNQTVTIDGFNKSIYSGEVKTKIASQNDLLAQFQPVSIREWPDLSTSLPHLIHNKMAVESGGIYWRRTPTYPVVGFQKELNLLRFDLVPDLLQKKDVKILSNVIDGYTCCELAPFSDYVSLFDGFDPDKALEFNQKHNKCIETFLKLSEIATRSKQAWHDYIDAYAHLRSYIWLGDALRSYAQRKVEEIGMDMELPLFYLEECAKEIQASLPEIDTQMHLDLRELALQFQESPFYEDVGTLKNNNAELYQHVEAIGKKYRFEHKISLDKEIDLNVAYTRLKREIDTVIQGKSLSTDKTTDPTRNLLPEMDQLKKWLRVTIWNRILQSDSHHVDARAKEIVRPQLVQLGNALLQTGHIDSAENIFNCSIEEVGNYIGKVHE